LMIREQRCETVKNCD